MTLTIDDAIHEIQTMLIVNAKREQPAIDMAVEALEYRKPMRVSTGEEHAWGKTEIVPACPRCDYILDRIEFLGDGTHKTSFCWHCGQMIDWSEVDTWED